MGHGRSPDGSVRLVRWRGLNCTNRAGLEIAAAGAVGVAGTAASAAEAGHQRGREVENGELVYLFAGAYHAAVVLDPDYTMKMPRRR